MAIGLNGPPFFSLSGFRSQVSMWLGPPPIQSMMQLCCRLRSCWALASSAPRNCMAGSGHGGRRHVAQEVAAGHPAAGRSGGRTSVETPMGLAGDEPEGAPRVAGCRSAVQDELVRVQECPEDVFEDTDRVGVGVDELPAASARACWAYRLRAAR